MGIWTYDKDRSRDCWETGLGIEGEIHVIVMVCSKYIIMS